MAKAKAKDSEKKTADPAKVRAQEEQEQLKANDVDAQVHPDWTPPAL